MNPEIKELISYISNIRKYFGLSSIEMYDGYKLELSNKEMHWIYLGTNGSCILYSIKDIDEGSFFYSDIQIIFDDEAILLLKHELYSLEQKLSIQVKKEIPEFVINKMISDRVKEIKLGNK